jgi:hypothetical protein
LKYECKRDAMYDLANNKSTFEQPICILTVEHVKEIKLSNQVKQSSIRNGCERILTSRDHVGVCSVWRTTCQMFQAEKRNRPHKHLQSRNLEIQTDAASRTSRLNQ